MRRLIGVVALLVLIAAVFFVLRQPSRSGLEATDATSPPSTTVTTTDATTEPSDTTTATTTPTDASTSLAPSTSIIEDPADPVEPKAVYAVTEVQFGEAGFVSITNVGSAPGNVGGYALCSNLTYFQIPDVELEPLEIVWIAFGDGAGLGDGAGIAKEVFATNGQIAPAEAAQGEMALYRGSDFGNPDQLVTYVQWGSSAHPREQVAVDAGLWGQGEFLTVPADAFGIQSLAPGRPAEGLADWTAGVGG